MLLCYTTLTDVTGMGDWFNKRRLLEPIGNILPAEFEMAYYLSQQAPATQAGLN